MAGERTFVWLDGTEGSVSLKNNLLYAIYAAEHFT